MSASTTTSLPDSFYVEFLKKFYPNNPENHTIPDGLIKFAKDHYTEPAYQTAEFAKRIIRIKAKANEEDGTSKKATRLSSYTRKTISQLLDGEKVEVTGVIMEKLRIFNYKGCAKCGRKSCGEHPDPQIDHYFHHFKMVDETGEIVVSFKGKVDFTEIDTGDKVRVFGQSTRYKDELTLRAYEFYVTQRVNVPKDDTPKPTPVAGSGRIITGGMERIVAELEEFGKIPQKVFEARLTQEGIKKEELPSNIKLSQDTSGGTWYELVK